MSMGFAFQNGRGELLTLHSRDIFHPLVTPLTTYTYTTGSLGSDPVSATDEQRLPPGGFNLRHGFPQWFGKIEKSRNTSGTSLEDLPESNEPKRHLDDIETPSQGAFPGPVSAYRDSLEFTQSRWHEEYPSISEVLRYFKTAFDDVQIMDNLPLEATGNPGAWKAWRAHRK
ncbi:MAG: hypothetical protein Q9167_007638 [Letrouitia subvulpina]